MKTKRPPLPALLMPVGALLLSLANGALADHDHHSVPDVSVLRIYSEIPPLEHAAVAKRSTRIVRGTVRSVTPFFFREGWVSRRVEVDVVESWKGAGPSRQSFVVHGGRIGRVVTTDSSAPTIEMDTEYVFYLQNARSDLAILTAGEQSCGRVVRDARGFTKVLLGGREHALASLREADRAEESVR